MNNEPSWPSSSPPCSSPLRQPAREGDQSIKDDEETIKKASAVGQRGDSQLDRLRGGEAADGRGLQEDRGADKQVSPRHPLHPERAQGAGGPRRHRSVLERPPDRSRTAGPLLGPRSASSSPCTTRRVKYRPFSERHPDLTVPQALRRRAALHAHRIAQGWSAARTQGRLHQPNLWPRFGVHEPMWGRVYDRTLDLRCGRSGPGSPRGLVQPRDQRDLLRTAAAPRGRSLEALLEAVAWVAHSIEIVQCHHPGWKVKVADCTADNGLHGRLVVGPRSRSREIDELVGGLPPLEVELAHAVASSTGAWGRTCSAALSSRSRLPGRDARPPAEAPPLAAGEIRQPRGADRCPSRGRRRALAHVAPRLAPARPGRRVLVVPRAFIGAESVLDW